MYTYIYIYTCVIYNYFLLLSYFISIYLVENVIYVMYIYVLNVYFSKNLAPVLYCLEAFLFSFLFRANPPHARSEYTGLFLL